jgi:hypothetical protein
MDANDTTQWVMLVLLLLINFLQQAQLFVLDARVKELFGMRK